MQSARQHYATHLGPVYSWMMGGVEGATQRGAQEIDRLPIEALRGASAVDLGAGFGMHSIPLARRGIEVLAIDSDATLLAELGAHATGLPITTIEGDLLDFRRHLKNSVRLILCMGDTLAHLASVEEVRSLIVSAAEALEEGGILMMSFRDYSVPLQGANRGILVRGDSQRILTCFLEYEGSYVTVNDLIHEFSDGRWGLRVGSYRKLRLVPRQVCETLERCGFSVLQEPGLAGMVRLVATRRADGSRRSG
jgi:SAM-dependent methyltransferase